MNLQQYTIKSQEAINKAIEITIGHEQNTVEPAHLLKALLEVDEHVIPFLLKKSNANVNRIKEGNESSIKSFPKVTGSGPFLSIASNNVFNKSLQLMKEFGDEFVSIE